MAIQNIDNETRTIVGDIASMTEKEKENVKLLCSLGYTFKQKKARNGEKRNREYYKGQLIAEDREIFEALAAKKYSTAVSFASRIIELGKYADKHPEGKAVVVEFRKLARKDFVEAKIYSESHIATCRAAKKKEKRTQKAA